MAFSARILGGRMGSERDSRGSPDSNVPQVTVTQLAEACFGGSAEKSANFALAFAACGLDESPHLVAELSLADMKELMFDVQKGPTDSLGADCLRLRQACANQKRNNCAEQTLWSPKGEVELKKAKGVSVWPPAWKWCLRLVTNGVAEDNLPDKVLIQQEFNLIIASLFLAFSIAALTTPPRGCNDEAGQAIGSCPNLQAVDLLLWATLTSTLVLAVVNAWSCAALAHTVAKGRLGAWIVDFYNYYNSASCMLVVGFSVLLPALSTRSFILIDNHPAYPEWLSKAVVVVLMGGWSACWMAWIYITRATFRVSMWDFASFNLGLLGIRTPRGQLDGMQARRRARMDETNPYMVDPCTSGS